ncbi:hypothetical protein FHX82_007140 [Amycolatopsis bartoniae]|uniref:Uncharacterized protein n=1 Tax=Amycolatopsis bartoniae TaxID=941986 RepID=A0A8H9ISK0_9PSEU|nr:DUF5691 domain-containing protein [Amycolatopsis bartoniae]MBB2940054.1 hypothetical protein [Amycolatopsis bartoniae]TVT09464.1 hypothetical protein FNH07_08655 [Amycolatopsis bartoniae]GHF53610.1 hypothetical protein GCM10017566_28780 [Amycolatopsis bartoniae]
MTDWDHLLATALVGTGRRPFRLDQLTIEGADRVEAATAEAAVLSAAALAAGYRRAGWIPPAWRGTPPRPADPDERPECTAAATQLLELLLARRVEGSAERLAAHWFAAARDSGRRPPFRLLPDLLRFGTANPDERAVVKEVLGPRGAWLAGHNPSWHWATRPRDVAGRFATGTRAERLALLGELRATDPAAARALVEDTWAKEPAALRAALLDTLHIGLSKDDEPLLERALDDRAASVRAAAAALLDSLPASARARRMAERARALWQRDATFDLPGEPDEAARRDGITDTREPGQGRATSWLIQLLAATPLSTWDTRQIGKADKAVLTGWTRAALRQRDQEWLVALARHQPTPELVAALTPEAAADVLSREQKVDTRFGHLLAAAPGPWAARFSEELVDRLWAAKKDDVLRLASGALAEHLHPATLGSVEAWLTSLAPTRKVAHRALRGVAHALTIRATILQEFS